VPPCAPIDMARMWRVDTSDKGLTILGRTSREGFIISIVRHSPNDFRTKLLSCTSCPLKGNRCMKKHANNKLYEKYTGLANVRFSHSSTGLSTFVFLCASRKSSLKRSSQKSQDSEQNTKANVNVKKF